MTPRPPNPGDRVAQRARARRDEILLARFPDFRQMRVLDLGGTLAWWRESAARPAAVTIVNLHRIPLAEAWLTSVRGDACAPPASVARERYDLVFSNSLIEHVGGHDRRGQFAGVVDRAAPHHWVQTPNRYFPIEPHWLFPGFQFLPVPVRATIAQRWPLGHMRPTGSDRAQALEAVRSVELLGADELARYFPGSTIVRERFAGMTKAIIAVR